MIKKITITILVFVFSQGAGFAMDCREHFQAGLDLHLSRDLESLSRDTTLLTEILDHYLAAQKMCPGLCSERPDLCNNIADIYQRMGELDLAVRFYKEAVRIKPDFMEAWCELGVIYEGKGLYGASLDAFLKTAELDPDYRKADTRAKQIALSKNCATRNAGPGQILTEEEMFDSLVCAGAFARARTKFGMAARNIVPSSVALSNIEFDPGSARLRPEAKPQLEKLLMLLKNQPALHIRIEGHTDDIPVTGILQITPKITCADNQCLSEHRAKTVEQYLTDGGIDSKRLATVGFGDTRPFDPGSRDRNRRVQLRAWGATKKN